MGTGLTRAKFSGYPGSGSCFSSFKISSQYGVTHHHTHTYYCIFTIYNLILICKNSHSVTFRVTRRILRREGFSGNIVSSAVQTDLSYRRGRTRSEDRDVLRRIENGGSPEGRWGVQEIISGKVRRKISRSIAERLLCLNSVNMMTMSIFHESKSVKF